MHPIRSLLFLFLLLPAPALAAPAAPTFDAMTLSKFLEDCATRIDTCTATFVKQEAFRNRLGKPETIEMKYRAPHDIYMRWIKGPNKGQETVYREGKNDGKLTGHRGGMLGMVSMDLLPTGSMAMEGNHHPITDAGIVQLCKMLHHGIATGQTNGDLSVVDLGSGTFDGSPVRIVENRFPETMKYRDYTVKKDETLWEIAAAHKMDMFVIQTVNGLKKPTSAKVGKTLKIPLYYCKTIRLFLDESIGVPVRTEIIDWNDKPFEIYEYRNVKLNLPIDDLDFSTENPAYRF